MFEALFRLVPACWFPSGFNRVVAVLIFVWVGDNAFAQVKPATWADGELLVGLRSGIGRDRVASLFSSEGATILQVIPQINVHRIKVPSPALDAVERALSRRPEVKFVERNRVLQPAAIPNDPLYSSAWHLDKIEAPKAWDLTRGSSNVVVAVVDTGMDAGHPDLQSKMVRGYNAYNNNFDTADVSGHGTMVGGVISAETENGLGVSSIAWMNPLMPIRITDSSLVFFYSVIANGITWAVDHGAKVINVSITGVAGSATISSAASYARNKGAVVVAAAGNCACFDSTPESSSIISVSATDGGDNLASWSSQGNYVDIAAPGVGIYTTTSGGGYGAPSGTSVASPVVAGVVALMMSANPSLKPAQIESLLESTADDLGPAGYDTAYGYGRINAYRAVAAAATNLLPPDTTAPVASITSPANGSTVSGGVSVAVSASDNVGVSRVDLYVDGSYYASDATTPYGFFIDTNALGNGSHSLIAVALDAGGNNGTSSTVVMNVNNNQVTDTQPPIVSIVAPVSTAKGGGNKLSVSVSASDNVGVAKVQLYVDGALVSTSTAAPYNFNINTAKLSAGSHTLQARAYDPSGNVGLSSPLSFTK